MKKRFYTEFAVMLRLLVIPVLLCLATIVSAQTKGLSIPTDNVAKLLDSLPVNNNARMALVIGNDEYETASLKNPVHDANSVASLLEHYGFQVTLVKNAGTREMLAAIDTFSKAVQEKRGITVFYFSGHGLQYNNQNFLVPANAHLREASEVPLYTIGINTVLSNISYSKHGMNIIILDACRNNPFYDKIRDLPHGLTYAMNKVKNTLLFFATSANDVAEDGTGNNSPFTESLLESITQNDSLELMYIAKQVTRQVEQKTNDRQTPQVVGTLTNDFYFKQKAARKPNLYILSIGISDYKDQHYNLRFSDKGALDFNWMFRKTAGNMYDSVYSYVLMNREASFQRMQNSISEIKKSARPGDLIFVYYSGNTAYDEDTIAYLMPFDADFNQPGKTGISQGVVVSLLADLPCKTLLFMDASAAGPAGESLAKELIQPRNNVVVLSATSQNQFSFESDKFQGTVFSYAIAEGLSKATSTEKPGMIDVESLSSYVIGRVSKLTNNMQVPRLLLPKGWQNFVIVNNAVNLVKNINTPISGTGNR